MAKTKQPPLEPKYFPAPKKKAMPPPPPKTKFPARLIIAGLLIVAVAIAIIVIINRIITTSVAPAFEVAVETPKRIQPEVSAFVALDLKTSVVEYVADVAGEQAGNIIGDSRAGQLEGAVRWLFETVVSVPGGIDYSNDIEPWLGNTIAVAVSPEWRPLLVLSSRDNAQATALLAKLGGLNGAQSSQNGGATQVTLGQITIALFDDQVLIGGQRAVEHYVDPQPGSSLAASGLYAETLEALPKNGNAYVFLGPELWGRIQLPFGIEANLSAIVRSLGLSVHTDNAGSSRETTLFVDLRSPLFNGPAYPDQDTVKRVMAYLPNSTIAVIAGDNLRTIFYNIVHAPIWGDFVRDIMFRVLDVLKINARSAEELWFSGGWALAAVPTPRGVSVILLVEAEDYVQAERQLQDWSEFWRLLSNIECIAIERQRFCTIGKLQINLGPVGSPAINIPGGPIVMTQVERMIVFATNGGADVVKVWPEEKSLLNSFVTGESITPGKAGTGVVYINAVEVDNWLRGLIDASPNSAYAPISRLLQSIGRVRMLVRWGGE